MPLRVAVTGDGAISALGRTVGENLAGLYAGTVQPPDRRPSSTLDNPPPVFNVEGPLGDEGQGRTAQLALHAAREALQAAWGGRINADPQRIGVCMGTTVACTLDSEPFYRAWRAGERPDLAPVRRYLGADLSSALANLAGAQGPRITVANACASGADALGVACGWLVSGACDVVIAGGADALARFPYLGFAVLQNAAHERCRPFDRDRHGLNLGEGAGVLILEREADARRRGARELGFLDGYASAGDAHHPTAPHPEGRGLRRAIAVAIAEAGLRPDEVGFINAHGTATTENDRVEGNVLADLLPRALVVATKGATGHTLGAAGALEAVFTLRNLLDGRVPQSAGFQTADPQCRTTPTRVTRALEASAAISTSLAFGGTNSVLVLRRGDAR